MLCIDKIIGNHICTERSRLLTYVPFAYSNGGMYIKLRYCREQMNLNSYSTVKNNEGIINFLKAY